jgi:hypothetical protein
MLNKKIFLLDTGLFIRHIDKCLKEDSLDTNLNSIVSNDSFDVAIVSLFKLSEEKERKIEQIIESKIKKIILIENGLELYLNSKNNLPYSVYSKVIPKNEICKKYLDIEKKIAGSKKQHVIFRVSEIYGQSMPDSLVEQLLNTTSGEFENSCHDFIYDGDVISAVEIALKNDVTGIFDIASGYSISLKNVVELIKKIKQDDFELSWKNKKLRIVFNCENFKFYKWEPLVNLELGIKTLLSLRRKYGDLQNTRDRKRKNF